MYLKSLEVQGFKSFANKIVFQFHNGITGVVGPNGSGKSNVSDAIRWVLGEQSARQLRGGSMQDVIFAGTQARKAMSYAYVAITLDNADHALPIDYEEVTVARRLYRSGESEYLINGTTVRMRDVQEMFFDTGIGKEGYSLIGQGQVERILNGKPEERRALFDEAAGIVKYKHRKQTAVKKLESEQANLVRVNDILAELTQRVEPLRKQSETAKVYLAKRDELKICDVNLFLIDQDRYQENLEKAENRLENARAEQEKAEEALRTAKEQYEQVGEAIRAIDAETARTNEELSGVRIERQECAGRIDLAHEQLQSLDSSDDQLRVRQGRLRSEITQRQAQQENSGKRLEKLEEEAAACSAKMEEASGRVQDLQEKIAKLTGEIDANKEQIIRILNERSDIQSGRQRASTLIEQISLRESELNSRALTLESEEQDQEKAREGLSGQQKDNREEGESLKERERRIRADLERVQKAFLEETARLEKLREEYQRESSRYDTLRAMTERYEGYGNSIRRVMEQKSREKGILGVVADLIQTQKKYELAVETALGGSIQNIVTDDEDTAKRMIAFLKENRFGRATFLPLTAMNRNKEFREKDALSESGVIGLASELVTCEDRFRGLAQHLLGRTVVVSDIDRAVVIARKYRYSLRLVTLDGELLSPGGSMTGGAFKNSSNLLGRRREIEEETQRLEKKKVQLEKLAAQVEEDHTKRNRLRDESAAIAGLLQKNEFDRTSLIRKEEDLAGRMDETKTAREKIAAEREEIARQKKELSKEQAASGQSLIASDASEKEANSRIGELQKEVDENNALLTEAEETLSKVRVQLAGFAQERNFISQNLTRLEEEIRVRSEEADGITQRIRDNESGRAEKRRRIEELTEQIAKTKEKEAALSEEIAELAQKKEKQEKEQKAFFDRREELTEQGTLLDREIFRLEDQLEKLKTSRERSVEYLWEEYELTPVACRELRRDDIGSMTVIKKRLADLKREIKALGNVNVNAIEEYREVSERYEFLTGQHEDLIRSAEELQKIIAQLDEGMRSQFREQFARVQTEFDQTFRDLFGGGKGTLELVEDEDILEAGIRVIAQPPGKKLQNMMQLSGGEKSLTAIALLFAIQNLKPSPFCLLDEIESALDESNVERFAKYLHKLTRHTQFIVITHRRGSMAYCDRLYGITMQEKGISALVSVDLVEKELDEEKK